MEAGVDPCPKNLLEQVARVIECMRMNAVSERQAIHYDVHFFRVEVPLNQARNCGSDASVRCGILWVTRGGTERRPVWVCGQIGIAATSGTRSLEVAQVEPLEVRKNIKSLAVCRATLLRKAQPTRQSSGNVLFDHELLAPIVHLLRSLSRAANPSRYHAHRRPGISSPAAKPAMTSETQ